MAGGSQQTQLDVSLRQYQALVEVAESIAAHRDLSSLLRDLKKRLHLVVRFDGAQVVLHDSKHDLMRRHTLPSTARPGERLITELTIEEAPAGWVWQTQQPLLITDLAAYESRYPRVVAELREYGFKTAYVLPLTSLGRRLGALVFISRDEKGWSEDDQELLQKIAKVVALAVNNVINLESARTAEIELKRRLEHLRLMLKITNEVASQLDLQELLQVICSSIREAMGNDIVDVSLFDHESGQLRAVVTNFPPEHPLGEKGVLIPLEGGPSGLAFTSGQPVFIDQPDRNRFNSDLSLRVFEEGYRSGGAIPLIAQGRKLGVLGVISKNENAFSEDEKELLVQVANQVAMAVDNALNYERARAAEEQAKRQSERVQLLLEINNAVVSNLDLPSLMKTISICLAKVSQYDAVGLALYDPELNQLRAYANPTDQDFIEEEEPISLEGSATSPSFKRILKQVETVAPTDSAVLIRGETGTGKELLARAIHNLSARRERTLVKLNCAAIPTGLLESELFGHEKGAFTGAIAQRIGRFELANKGTLFLDEVGDIPVELQPKLLRVLQEQEFERLGSTRTQKVDVRLIAATNSDLEQMVADKKYRSDLYYRLNVFPVTIPPLRERREDIPALARFFTQKYARRLKKRIETISTEAMTALSGYHWPGNVRELEHFIERAVVLTQGPDLEVSPSELKPLAAAANANISTLEDAEREHILRALEEAHWVVGGANGAAARLGMKRTTLQSRMQKLGLERGKS